MNLGDGKATAEWATEDVVRSCIAVDVSVWYGASFRGYLVQSANLFLLCSLINK